MIAQDYTRIREAIYKGYYNDTIVPNTTAPSWHDDLFATILSSLMETLSDGMDLPEAKDEVWNICDAWRSTFQRIMSKIDDLEGGVMIYCPKCEEGMFIPEEK